MIRSYQEFDQVVAQALSGVVGVSGAVIPVRYGTPQATVLEEKTIPCLTIVRYDDRIDVQRGSSYELLYQHSEVDEHLYLELERAYPVILSYQVDMYSHMQREMLDLERQTLAKLPRWRGALLDPDDYTVRFELTDTRDLTQDIETQRLFRRSLSYDFRVWVEHERPPAEVKDVQHIEVDIHDLPSGDRYESFWVPEEPS